MLWIQQVYFGHCRYSRYIFGAIDTPDILFGDVDAAGIFYCCRLQQVYLRRCKHSRSLYWHSFFFLDAKY